MDNHLRNLHNLSRSNLLKRPAFKRAKLRHSDDVRFVRADDELAQQANLLQQLMLRHGQRVHATWLRWRTN